MPSTASFWTIINNVYDAASAALRLNLSYDHTHSSGSGSGGQLDWDMIWSDAVHSHGTNTEGGQLDWDLVWTDAAHNHSAAAEGGVLDHGQSMSSASLADDDHPQYVQENVLTTNGDIPYATGSATWTRLAAGSLNYIFTSTGIGSAASWQAAAGGIASGSYTGNSTVNRAIAHGLSSAPKQIIIHDTYPVIAVQLNTNGTFRSWDNVGAGRSYAVTAPDSTSFYVGNSAGYAYTGNNNTIGYNWVAT